MKNLKAFSIPELLIVIGITGVICAMMLTVVKPTDKYLPYAYYNAYYTLATAAYNIKEDARDLQNTEGAEDVDKAFPGDMENVDSTTAAKELCRKLATNPNPANEEENKLGYLNTTVYNCGANFKTVPITGSDSQFKKENMAFRSSNSMRYFISPMQKVTVKDPLNGNADVELKYFLVWVDLNAERGPNTATWNSNKKKAIDIVPFIILMDGTVLPTGFPTTDSRYLTAHVQYSASNTEQFSQSPRPYYDSVIAAFNKNEYPVHDVYSLFSSFQKALKGSAAEIKSYTPSVTGFDEKCTLESVNDAPICTIVIDEKKKF